MDATEPRELIQELYKAGFDELDRKAVDGILARGGECAPLLVEVLHADAEDPVVARALALLGEIGDPPVLHEILPFFAEDEDEDAISESAEWAFQRIAIRHPEAALRVIGELAAEAGPLDLNNLARHLSMLPDVPGRAETLLGFARRLGELDREERALLVSNMIVTAMFLDGPSGELAGTIRTQYGADLNRDAIKLLKDVEADLLKQPYDPKEEEPSSIHDVVCGGFTMEEADAPYVAEPKPGRNDACWCGSGKKYKKCHLEADAAR